MKSSLEGIRILDLTRVIPGPYCSLILGDLGCNVIKVEEPGKGDYTREMDHSLFYALNRNKKSLTLNLKTSEGKRIFCTLAQKADVILESFRPGVTKKFGIDYENVYKINNGIVYCSITAYGQEGPYQMRAGHDLDFVALAGVFSISSAEPHVLPLAISDLNSGMFAGISILAALFERERGGEGQYIDIALMDSALSWVGTKIFKKSKEAETQYAGFGIFKTKDNRFLSLSAIEDKFWSNLCDTLARSGFVLNFKNLKMDERTTRLIEINESIREIIKNKSLRDWVDLFSQNDIPFASVNTLEELPFDPQIAFRGLIFDIDHPRFGKMRQVKFPGKLSSTPAKIRTPPPELGEHTEEILQGLGYSTKEIEHFRKSGVI
jgi:crotonobetainyl-CoA:carnitine CoA-transferase CaiB-like acyl-CoA transferase